jgi:sugar (pentulose or hexulose) kinase
MSYISVIDLGTGSIRNTIYDLSGKILAVSKRENPISHPQPGWAEQNPVYWWEAVKETFIELDPEIRASIAAISATSQREGIVPVNNRFEPLDNIIIWLDGRTHSQGDDIKERLGENEIYEITGLVPNPAWSLAKILWIKKHRKEIYSETFKFLQAEDYLLSKMCGRAVSEFSIASRTCMLDVVNREWSEHILNVFDIDRGKLPELLEPGTRIGPIRPEVAEAFDLPTEVSIFMGAGDQQAAALGAGATEEGMVSIGIGTSSALSMTLNRPVKDPGHRIILNCAALPGKWEYEPPIWNTGGLIKWFREQVQCSDLSYEAVNAKIREIPAGCNGLIAIPYFSGAGSPRWNPMLKGGFYGLSLDHNQYHMFRALTESIAFEIKFNTDTIQSSGIRLKRIILSGGASNNRPLCQIVADVLQTEVYIFTEAEASSRGVYYLVRNTMQSLGAGGNDMHQVQPEYVKLKPDPLKKEIYGSVYNKYLQLGDKLASLDF